MVQSLLYSGLDQRETQTKQRESRVCIKHTGVVVFLLEAEQSEYYLVKIILSGRVIMAVDSRIKPDIVTIDS